MMSTDFSEKRFGIGAKYSLFLFRRDLGKKHSAYLVFGA